MAVEKLEIGKEYYLDQSFNDKGVLIMIDNISSSYVFEPTYNTKYTLNKDGYICFFSGSLESYTLVN